MSKRKVEDVEEFKKRKQRKLESKPPKPLKHTTDPQNSKDKYIYIYGKKTLNIEFLKNKTCSVCAESNPVYLCYNKYVDKIFCGNCHQLHTVQSGHSRKTKLQSDLIRKVKENIGQCQVQKCPHKLIPTEPNSKQISTELNEKQWDQASNPKQISNKTCHEMFHLRFLDNKPNHKDKRKLRRRCELGYVRMICLNCTSLCENQPNNIQWDETKKEKMDWNTFFEHYINENNVNLCEL